METQYQLTLPGGFALPIVLIRQRLVDYQLETVSTIDLSLASKLSFCLQSQLCSENVACTIVNAQEQLTKEDKAARLDAVYSCVEMIGRERVVQIGDLHGQTN